MPWLAAVVLAGCGDIRAPSSWTGGSDGASGANSRDAVSASPDASNQDAGSVDAPDTTPSAQPDGATIEDGGALDAAADARDAQAPDARTPDASAAACDYRFGADDVLRIEAEDLPLIEDWEVRSGEPGYSGSGYITWAGRSFNNAPGNGLMAIRLQIPRAGRYRLQWRNRIGRGDNTTEHNDTWVRFVNATEYYGKRGPDGEESRRYPKPQCDDDAFMTAVRARPEVYEARCPAGSTKDGWMKVYSSGARDWRWSTRTSDHDAHDIYVELDAPGVVILELSARADFHLIDRIVLHEESVARGTVEDALPPTPCP